jgi:NitT/TauT family transport system permease protein
MSRVVRWLRARSGTFLIAGGIVAAWYLLAASLNSTVFPTPAESLPTLVDNFSRPSFRDSVLNSLQLLAISYVLCVVAGSVVGFCIGLLPFWKDALSPIVYAVYSIPKVTLYPIFLLLLGVGDISRIGFAFIHGFVPMVLIVMGATSSIAPIYLKLAASVRMGMFSLMRRILIPSILPALSTGMRLSFGLTFLGLILAEMFSGSTGLGYELLRNVTLVRMGDIVGQVVLVAVIALVPTGLLQLAERRIHRRYEGGAPTLGQTAL